MPVYKAEGIVLRRHNLGESDRVVVLLTREHGKVRAAARGTRKITSALAGKLEPFTEGAFLLARGKSLDVVAQVDVLDAHAPLRRDLDRLTQAAYMVELVDAFVGDADRSDAVYLLFQEALAALERGDAPLVVLRFALQLAALLGYRPALERCAVCGAPVDADAHFSAPLGGAVCDADRRRDPLAIPLSAARRRTLAALLSRASLPPVAEGDRAPLARLVQQYLEYRLEGRLRAPGVIERLASSV